MSVMRRGVVITLLVLMLGTAACSGSLFALDDPLDGTRWHVETIDGNSPMGGTELTLEFGDGQVSGTTGCNSFGGGYQVAGPELSFGDLAQTLMACLDPQGVMEQEQAYMLTLNSTEAYEIQDGELVLSDTTGVRVVLSRAVVP